MTEFANLSAQPVPCRPGLEANTQATIAASQPLDRPLDRRRPVLDLTQKPDLTAAATLGHRHRVLHLRHVERDKSFPLLSHGLPSVREAQLGPSEQPSFAR